MSHSLWGFDAVSLYPSAMLDENSIYPRIETGYVLTSDMNVNIVEKFNNGKFTQRNAILKRKYYIPKNLIVQHIPLKERETKIEINRMRNGYIIDYLTFVEIQELGKIGGKVIHVSEGVNCHENFKVSPFKKDIDKLFALRKKNKVEGSKVMQLLVKLMMNSLYGEQIRRVLKKNSLVNQKLGL